MDPVIGAGLIQAGAGLLGGLFGASAAREKQRREMMYQGQMQGLQTQSQGGNMQVQNENDAFNKMMENYARAFISNGR